MSSKPTTTAVADGVVRVTWPLPFRIDHVHCYLVGIPDGWMLVDTGLGASDDGGVWEWQDVLDSFENVSVIVLTHNHPDHIGGAAGASEAADAPVVQSARDYATSRRWSDERWLERLGAHLCRHGAPRSEVEPVIEASRQMRAGIRTIDDPVLAQPGDVLHGWRVIELPGHADGHIGLHKGDALVVGDALLDPITPGIGLLPGGSPDPLGDYQRTLYRIAQLRPSIAFTGHGRLIIDPPRRARQILQHHEQRLARTLRAVSDSPKTGWEVSYSVFPAELVPALRRSAHLETLAHLERLVADGAVERHEDIEVIRYQQAGRGGRAGARGERRRGFR
jgi:glyoxylase-like metal-dependent hydrolase (beta-lactamase superfamily II)